MLNILVIQDTDADFQRWTGELRTQGVDANCVRAEGRTELMVALEGGDWDVVLSDHAVPGASFRESLNLVRQWRPDLPVILIGGTVSGQQASDLLELGIDEFVPRNRMSRLVPAIERSVAQYRGRARDKARIANLAYVLEGIGLGVSYVSDQGVIRYNNPAYDAMFGYEPGELIGQHVSVLNDLSKEENRRRIDEVMVGLKRQGFYSGEFPNRRKDGSRFVSRAWITALPVATEVAWVSVQEDITERRHTEEALARARQRSEAFLRNASDGVHILDSAGNVLEVSDSFCEMLGYGRDELIGANVSLWDAHFDPEELKLAVQRQFDKDGYSRFETRHRRKDGGIFDVEITGHPLDLDGRRVLFNSSRDITERKALADALQASEAALSAIFECSPAGIGVTRLSDGRFIRVNDAVPAIWGYEREEFVGRSAAELGLWVDPGERDRLVRFLREKNQTVQRQMLARRKDGQIRRVLMSAKIVVIGGEECLLGTVTDVTGNRK